MYEIFIHLTKCIDNKLPSDGYIIFQLVFYFRKGHMPVVEFLVSKEGCSFDFASNNRLTAQQYASK